MTDDIDRELNRQLQLLAELLLEYQETRSWPATPQT